MTAPVTKANVVPIDLIDEGTRQRSFDPTLADAYAATLPTLGLMQPIEVARSGERFRLLDGKHRLEAAKRVGWETIPVTIGTLDDANEDASAALHEAFANLMRGDLSALDRMAHLAAAQDAHNALYPNASKAGRPRKATRADEDNREIFSQFGFARTVSDHVGLGPRAVNLAIATWRGLSPKSRSRLAGTPFARKGAELTALSAAAPTTQELVLNLLLSQPPAARSVEEALAIVEKRTLPDAHERKVTRYARDLGRMDEADRERVLAANEDLVRAFAVKRGWAS